MNVINNILDSISDNIGISILFLFIIFFSFIYWVLQINIEQNDDSSILFMKENNCKVIETLPGKNIQIIKTVNGKKVSTTMYLPEIKCWECADGKKYWR